MPLHQSLSRSVSPSLCLRLSVCLAVCMSVSSFPFLIPCNPSIHNRKSCRLHAIHSLPTGPRGIQLCARDKWSVVRQTTRPCANVSFAGIHNVYVICRGYSISVEELCILASCKSGLKHICHIMPYALFRQWLIVKTAKSRLLCSKRCARVLIQRQMHSALEKWCIMQYLKYSAFEK